MIVVKSIYVIPTCFNRMVSSAWSVGHCLNQCQYLLQGTSFCPTSFSVSATSPTTLFPPVSYAVYLSYSLHSSTYDESISDARVHNSL